MQTTAEVIKLDKSFPAIRTKEGIEKRAEFSSMLAKKKTSVAICDELKVTLEDDLENAIIEEILTRRNKLIRNDPVNRKKEQVLASNFDQIAICVVAGEENFNHLARMLVIARNASVPITLIFTKCDIDFPNFKELENLIDVTDNVIFTSVQRLDAGDLRIKEMPELGDDLGDISMSHFCEWKNKRTILLGKSGVGKSTLVNALCGEIVCKQGDVREFDNKGRHTTVARTAIKTERYGEIVDMPGVRSLGLINCEQGLKRVFSQIYDNSKKCRFRNCAHRSEPGCAVKGSVPENLLESFAELHKENETNSTTFRR